jgi:hypothetical protein
MSHIVAAEREIARLNQLIIGLVRAVGIVGPEGYLSTVVGNDPTSEGWPVAELKEEQISYNRTRVTVVPLGT